MPDFRDILINQQRELEQMREKTYVPRSIRLTALDKDIIKVIIGPRRAGKSFFAVHQLSGFQNFGYVNFDDENLVNVSRYDDIIETVNSIYGNPKLLFFDEIQNLPKWELFVNRLQRQGYNLVITGSNSRLLSKELSTHLTGRYLETIVLPFSFPEYVAYFGELTTAGLKNKMQNYLNFGGFPEPLVKGIDYNDYLKTLHDSVIFKDILRRYSLRNPNILVDLSRYLITNSASPVSYRNLTGLVGVRSAHTVQKYLAYLVEAFLIFEVKGFSFKYKEQVKANKKVYAIDNGYIGSRAFRFTPNIGVLYENMVAVELKRRELNRDLEFYYYRNAQGYEVDFVVKEGLEVTELIQVSLDVSDPRTRQREVRSLLHASRDLKCQNLTLITGDYESRETVEWYDIKGDVRFIPLHKWLCTFKD